MDQQANNTDQQNQISVIIANLSAINSTAQSARNNLTTNNVNMIFITNALRTDQTSTQTSVSILRADTYNNFTSQQADISRIFSNISAINSTATILRNNFTSQLHYLPRQVQYEQIQLSLKTKNQISQNQMHRPTIPIFSRNVLQCSATCLRLTVLQLRTSNFLQQQRNITHQHTQNQRGKSRTEPHKTSKTCAPAARTISRDLAQIKKSVRKSIYIIYLYLSFLNILIIFLYRYIKCVIYVYHFNTMKTFIQLL
ncbi:Hypothetical_protein [Hexamita inflata]|uniref:Hypothetical_protein n=1 Tax=Hexamita inflata TaxID=28002 RepID=A0AA86P7H7_9EUKA|nr:Hypothetical protein HINF_LOCUS19539 [Hexamita inflata]